MIRFEGGYNYQRGMSNRAISAYDDGERPLSKWTKEEIKGELYRIFCEEDGDEEIIPLLMKLPLVELKEQILYKSSWHHTSKYYNRTGFYAISYDVLDLTKRDVENFLEKYNEYKKENDRVKNNLKENKEALFKAEKTGEDIAVTYTVCGKEYSDNVKITKKLCNYGTYYYHNSPLYDKDSAEEAKKFFDTLPKSVKDFINNSYAIGEELNLDSCISKGGNIYEKNRKPTCDHDYFREGEKRLIPTADGFCLQERRKGKWIDVEPFKCTLLSYPFLSQCLVAKGIIEPDKHTVSFDGFFPLRISKFKEKDLMLPTKPILFGLEGTNDKTRKGTKRSMQSNIG